MKNLLFSWEDKWADRQKVDVEAFQTRLTRMWHTQ